MTNGNHNLTLITEQNHDLKLSLAYATPNNFTGTPVYTNPVCYLHCEATLRLERAIELLKPLKLRLKVWDAYRPLAAQQLLFNHMSDPNYVSHPKTGSRPHCRGVAIDLTLIDQYENELEMGTAFDDFRLLAHHGNDQVSEQAQKNRLMLAGIMSISGFESIPSEWWHYQLPNVSHYPVIEEGEVSSNIMK
ncbi:D-alanyl-D-alanine dipeptidase [Endozoicomonas sp. (ex Bugula neritina AB1)]|nr:D-alanyl-D-alanine dipeptidase [Endozoicomonas sp. (ex Bugula neritina AB1)]